MANGYDISEPLRFLLAKNKITAYEFSKKIGINRAATSQYISGKKKASLARIDVFCDFFGVEREFFIDFENNKAVEQLTSFDEQEDDSSVFTLLSELVTEKVTDYNLNKYKGNFIKNFNYYFDVLDTDQKRSLLIQLHSLLEESQDGEKTTNLAEIDFDLFKLKKLLEEYSIYLSIDQIKQMLSNSSEKGLINVKGYKDFLYGFKMGIISALEPDRKSKVVAVNKLLEETNTLLSNDIQLDHDSIDYLKELIISLNRGEYFESIIKLRCFVAHFESIDDLVTFDFRDRKFLLSIIDLDDTYFKIVLDIVKNIVGKDYGEVKTLIKTLTYVINSKDSDLIINLKRLENIFTYTRTNIFPSEEQYQFLSEIQRFIESYEKLKNKANSGEHSENQ